MNYPTLEDAVGKTPLVRLQRLGVEQASSRRNVLLGKLEGNNPAGSVKDRPALSMIRRAEERGNFLATANEDATDFGVGAGGAFKQLQRCIESQELFDGGWADSVRVIAQWLNHVRS